MTSLAFRNVEASPREPVERWPVEALQAALERGGLEHWRPIARAIRIEPWGPVARAVEEILSHSRPYGVAETLERVIARARAEAERHERKAVAGEVEALVKRSGLSRAEFASRIGTSTSRLSTYVNGKVAPSSTLLLRMLRLADGPDEIHKMVLARRELNRWSKRAEGEASGELEPRHTPRPI